MAEETETAVEGSAAAVRVVVAARAMAATVGTAVGTAMEAKAAVATVA